MLTRALCVLILAAGASCGPANPCDEGLGLGEAGRCELLLTQETCGPGSMPRLGSEECVSVGWTTCPGGFQRDPSGWGCSPVLAPACDLAEMERLGEAGCVPIGDCGAPFPPADATHFVDPAFPDARLDAHHFRAIIHAVEAAPAGAVVAVADGLYSESVVLSRPIRLVGRCPARTGVTTQRLGYPGLTVNAARDVVIEGLLIRDAHPGVHVHSGGKATLRGVLLLGNEVGGLVAQGPGSTARLERGVIRQTLPYSDGTQGWGASALEGGRIELGESVLDRNHEAGLGALGQGSSGSLERTVVRRTAGRGLGAQAGATLEVRDSAILESGENGLVLSDASTLAVVRGTAFRGAEPSSARGISVQEGARLELFDASLQRGREVGLFVSASEAVLGGVLLHDTRPDPTQGAGWGLGIQGRSRVEAERLAVVGARDAGIVVMEEGVLSLERSLVTGVTAGVADPVALAVMGVASVRASTLLGNAGAGLASYPGAEARLTRTLIRGTLLVEGIFGHGALMLGGLLELWDSRVDHSAGTAVAGSEGRGLIAGCTIADNATALHAIPPVTIEEIAEARPAGLGELLVTRDSRFQRNLSRLGVGEVVLPAPPALAE